MIEWVFLSVGFNKRSHQNETSSRETSLVRPFCSEGIESFISKTVKLRNKICLHFEKSVT